MSLCSLLWNSCWVAACGLWRSCRSFINFHPGQTPPNPQITPRPLPIWRLAWSCDGLNFSSCEIIQKKRENLDHNRCTIHLQGSIFGGFYRGWQGLGIFICSWTFHSFNTVLPHCFRNSTWVCISGIFLPPARSPLSILASRWDRQTIKLTALSSWHWDVPKTAVGWSLGWFSLHKGYAQIWSFPLSCCSNPHAVFPMLQRGHRSWLEELQRVGETVPNKISPLHPPDTCTNTIGSKPIKLSTAENNMPARGLSGQVHLVLQSSGLSLSIPTPQKLKLGHWEKAGPFSSWPRGWSMRP